MTFRVYYQNINKTEMCYLFFVILNTSLISISVLKKVIPTIVMIGTIHNIEIQNIGLTI